MRQKTIVGLIMAAGAALMIAVGGWVMALIVLVLICFGVQEEFHALAQAGHRPVAWPTWVGMIVSIPDAAYRHENDSASHYGHLPDDDDLRHFPLRTEAG